MKIKRSGNFIYVDSKECLEKNWKENKRITKNMYDKEKDGNEFCALCSKDFDELDLCEDCRRCFECCNCYLEDDIA